MMYADFAYYQDVFFGVQIQEESEYRRLATRAATEIDYFTFGRARSCPELEAVKMAACAAAEVLRVVDRMQSTDSGDLQSETVGSYSRTYRSGAEVESSARARVKAALERYLAPTGLMYRGVGVCTRHM